MFDYGWLNVGSLVLGLIAWILPVVNIMKYNIEGHKNWLTLSVLSMSACAISLWFQILYNHHLVEIQDWSALMDTTATLVRISMALLIVTIVLNGINVFFYKARS